MVKKIILITVAALIALSSAAPAALAQKKKTETVVFDTSITCNNCKKKVEENIPFIKGVKDLKVDVPSKKITVMYDPARTTPEELRKAVEKLGYTAIQVMPESK